MQSSERYHLAKKITLLGVLSNIVLGITKVIGGAWFHSHALIADGLHSFADILVDSMVLVASKFGGQHKDINHPYGHQRIETAATLFLAMILVLTGFGIAWDAIEEGLHHVVTLPNPWALSIASLSILFNEGLFFITKHIGQRIQSNLLITNAWHHRSDSTSSLVVLIGLLATLTGYAYFDTLAAILVGALIIHMGIKYCWNSIKELVDTAIDEAQIKQIESVIQSIDGVQKMHQLRTRTMGKDIFIDVHVIVAPTISVSEGHFIAQCVHRTLLKEIPNACDVTVHIDPEDDEVSPPSLHLPSRAFLEEKILHAWQLEDPQLKNWVLHYLDGALRIDLIYEVNDIASFDPHKKMYCDMVNTLTYPISLRFFLEVKVKGT